MKKYYIPLHPDHLLKVYQQGLVISYEDYSILHPYDEYQFEDTFTQVKHGIPIISKPTILKDEILIELDMDVHPAFNNTMDEFAINNPIPTSAFKAILFPTAKLMEKFSRDSRGMYELEGVKLLTEPSIQNVPTRTPVKKTRSKADRLESIRQYDGLLGMVQSTKNLSVYLANVENGTDDIPKLSSLYIECLSWMIDEKEDLFSNTLTYSKYEGKPVTATIKQLLGINSTRQEKDKKRVLYATLLNLVNSLIEKDEIEFPSSVIDEVIISANKILPNSPEAKDLKSLPDRLMEYKRLRITIQDVLEHEVFTHNVFFPLRAFILIHRYQNKATGNADNESSRAELYRLFGTNPGELGVGLLLLGKYFGYSRLTNDRVVLRNIGAKIIPGELPLKLSAANLDKAIMSLVFNYVFRTKTSSLKSKSLDFQGMTNSPYYNIPANNEAIVANSGDKIIIDFLASYATGVLIPIMKIIGKLDSKELKQIKNQTSINELMKDLSEDQKQILLKVIGKIIISLEKLSK
ncbi:MAG: hypothetical protein IH946_02745 [Bacteroidetes bacterium]|nr:hypothetical protein [Bacteroidota bacterium]